ncbi:helix-turn-helix domain-containing protein [Listeria valentina]|uniref:helix-turn-helix domain-containing protein n=1 Tax=Listeria valentina TaxID=2705293 RepID=UPI0014322E0A|nr:helix-turn-helix domain-containing protein [Listeria valentina]
MKIGLDMFDSTLKKEWDLLAILRGVDRWFSTEELREKLDVTPAYLLKLINKLVSDIDEFGDSELEIHVSKGRGIRFETNHSDANPRDLLIFLTEETLGFTLFKALLNEDFGSTQKFAYDHFVSDATVRRTLNKFRDAIVPYEMKISRNNAIIEGKETQIRLFLNIVLWKVYAGKGWPFDGVNEQYVDFLVNSLIKEGNLHLTALQKRQLMYQIAVAMIRRRNQHFVEYDPAWAEILEDNKAFSLFKQKTAPFSTTFSNSAPGEIAFFYLLLIIQNENLQTLPLLKTNFLENKKNNSSVYQATEILFDTINQTIMEIPEDKQDLFLLNAFSFHLFAKVFHYFSTDINGYDYQVAFDPTMPSPIAASLHRNILKLIDNLYKKTKNEIFLKSDYLVSKYALLLSYIGAHLFYEPKVTIKISTDLPYLAYLRIREQICNLYGNSFNIQFVDETAPEKSDILLTNIPLEQHVERHVSDRIIFINRNLTTRNLLLLGKNLREITLDKQALQTK